MSGFDPNSLGIVCIFIRQLKIQSLHGFVGRIMYIPRHQQKKKC